VLQTVDAMNAVTADVKNHAAEMLSGSDRILSSGQNLSTVTSSVRESMRAMSESIKRISTAVDHVEEISEQNKSSIDILMKDVSQFIIGEGEKA
jgi:methyl-accepting chemotaxis protein